MVALTHREGSRRASGAIWGTAALLLASPAIAMVLTREVRWSALDFVVAAVILGGLCGAIELVLRLRIGRRARIGGIVALVACALVVWADAAVGIWPQGSLLGGS